MANGENSFQVSKQLLIHESGYFKSALNGGFKETLERSVSISGDWDPAMIHGFIYWLYGTSIELVLTDEQLSCDEDIWVVAFAFLRLAEYLQAPRLHNEIMNFLVHFAVNSKISMDIRVVEDVWNFTLVSSKSRLFVLDYFNSTHGYLSMCFKEGPATIASYLEKDHLDLISKEFLFVLVKEIAKHHDQGLQIEHLTRCERYHRHENKEDC